MEKKNKRKINHFKKFTKRPSQFTLQPNQRGFLCTCNSREKECVREAYNILNEHADLLFGGSALTPSKVDIDDDLDAEINNLRTEDKHKRFQVVESGAKNVLFIRTSIDEPVKLAHHILQSVHDNNRHQTRHLIRLVPVEVTCKAFLNDVLQAVEPLLEKHFKEGPKSYSVVFNRRNNNSLNKDEVIKAIADKVAAIRNDHKVNLKEGDWTIVVEVIRSIALVAVVPDFLKYKKFNVHLTVNSEVEDGMTNVQKLEELCKSVGN